MRELRAQEREIRMLSMVAAMGGGKIDPPEWGAADVWLEEWLTGEQKLGEQVPEPHYDEMVALGLRG